MGGICSADSNPDVPKVIRPDPAPNVGAVTFAVRRLGQFIGRDYAVYDTKIPESSEGKVQAMWLWLNKSNGSVANTATIDLENFTRTNPADEKKGQVLWRATITEVPKFDSFCRPPSGGWGEMYSGFFNAGQTPQEMGELPDSSYVNHSEHLSRHPLATDHQGPGIITKWRLMTSAAITDGDLHRGSPFFGSDPLNLEVFAKGTVVTTYQKVVRQVEDRDSEGKVTGHHTETSIVKHESPFVDRIEYRLVFRGMLWQQWVVAGNTSNSGHTDVTFASPLFQTVVGGGWFTPTSHTCATNGGFDPTLCLLVSHLCCTEYSVSAIVSDLMKNVHTPHGPYPDGFSNYGLLGQNPHFQSKFSVNGVFVVSSR